MTPYYSQDGITIYHGDCRAIVPQLSKVPLVLTDPPYALGASRGEWGATADVAIGLYETARRVEKDGAMFCFSTSSGRGIQYTLAAVGKTLPFNRLLVWRHALSTSKAAGPWKWDLVSILGFGRCTFGLATASAEIATAEPKAGRLHPAQVPGDVAEWLYTPFENTRTVLDPFMGSGSLLGPAVRRGRSVVGIELEEKWCELAVQRLSQSRKDGDNERTNEPWSVVRVP